MVDLILAINPGSTSTKIGVFDGINEAFSKLITHKPSELEDFAKVTDQMDLRLNYILDFLQEKGINVINLKAVVGRGGLLKPIPGGSYLVNKKMIIDLKEGRQGEHACNLGGILAWALGKRAHCPAYIVDPVVVDELNPLARFSGMPEIERRSIFHALNQKMIARRYASELGKSYQELSLIVVHLGGGISVGLHYQGKVIDVNNALCGEGPFSPNRSGSLPVSDLTKLCFSNKYTYKQIRNKVLKKGGLISYLGTNDLREVEKMIREGNKKASLVFEAMVYQVGKEIGSLAPVLNGRIDAILLTGGMAYSNLFTTKVSQMVSFIAPIKIYPGEEELLALAKGVFRVLKGEEKALIYE